MTVLMRKTQKKRGRYAQAAIVLVFLILVGCGGTSIKMRTPGSENAADAGPVGQYKVGRPYQIKGKWYYPKVNYDYAETGIASWYGPKFHGKKTANGERFDQNALTAAHRTLPLPSMVRVTNIDNGRQIKMRINDRGPFSRGRILDLSARGAELLGFKKKGTAKVKVEILENESRRLAAAARNGMEMSAESPDSVRTVTVERASLERGDYRAKSGREDSRSTNRRSRQVDSVPQTDSDVTYVTISRDAEIFIQAGAFLDAKNARRLGRELERLAPARIEKADVHDRRYFRVRLGPLETVPDADELLTRLLKSGHRDAQIIVD